MPVLFDHTKDLSTDTCHNIMLSERNSTQRPHHIRLHLCKMFRIGKSIETENKLVIG